MRISVYNVHVLALLVAALAAALSGIVLSRTFSSLQAASELAQRNLGEGQVRAFITIVAYQMERIRSESDASTRRLAMWAARLPPGALAPENVLQSLNQSVYDSWVPENVANNTINGQGLVLMYPAQAANVTFARAFGVWKDVTRSGKYTYTYAAPSPINNLSDVYQSVWTDVGQPCLTGYLYSYDPFDLYSSTYMQDNYFSNAVAWAASDGNAYWEFTHQRRVVVHGVSATVQAWDVSLDWRDRMDAICSTGSEMVVIDNNDMVMAATSDEEALRLAKCQASRIDGMVQAACVQIPAASHPVLDIRDLRNTLFNQQWVDLSTPPIPVSHVRVELHGQPYMVVVATLFSSGDFRTTVLWYQPWTELSTNVTVLIAVICFLTILSTLVLVLLGVFGILRPLIHLGRSMRSVAQRLKYGDGGGDKALVQCRSVFQEVYNIQLDFETIVMDFLGFSSTRKASEQADTVLNHILKNTMADAAACIQLYAEDRAAQVSPDLAQAVTCLARGMQWCRKRHVLLRMAEGDYLPTLHPVALREFGQQLVRGRDVRSSLPNEVVLLDEVLCDILLDNALNNAFRHGDPDNPDVQFTAELAPLPPPAGPGSGDRRPHRLLTFCVRNRADPAKPPVTPQLVDTVLNGYGATGSEEFVYSSALSEHLGLRHMFKVAATHQMDLSVGQDGDTVVLQARVKVQLAKEPSASDRTHLVPEEEDVLLPTGLEIWALDDSPIARRLLHHSLPKHFPGATVRVMGDTTDHISMFITGAVQADIIILDQNLDYDPENFLGTDVLAELLQRGCRAFVCFRSGSAAPGCDEAFRAAGAHCVLGKDLRPDDFFKALKRLYRTFRYRTPDPPLLSVPLS